MPSDNQIPDLRSMAIPQPSSAPDEGPYFFRLPLELREIIYEYACADTELTIKLCSGDPLYRTRRSRPELEADHNSGIIFACKQTRIEALKIYYRSCIFWIRGPPGLARWVDTIPRTFHASLCDVRCADLQPAGGDIGSPPFFGMRRDMDQKNALAALRAANEVLRKAGIRLPAGAVKVRVGDSHKSEWLSADVEAL